MYSFTSQCLDSVRKKQGCEWLSPAADRARVIAKVVKIKILRIIARASCGIKLSLVLQLFNINHRQVFWVTFEHACTSKSNCKQSQNLEVMSYYIRH